MKDKTNSFIPQMLKDLEDIQLKLMSNSLDNSLWLCEQVLRINLENTQWNKISIGLSEHKKIGPYWVIKTLNTFEVQ